MDWTSFLGHKRFLILWTYQVSMPQVLVVIYHCPQNPRWPWMAAPGQSGDKKWIQRVILTPHGLIGCFKGASKQPFKVSLSPRLQGQYGGSVGAKHLNPYCELQTASRCTTLSQIGVQIWIMFVLLQHGRSFCTNMWCFFQILYWLQEHSFVVALRNAA